MFIVKVYYDYFKKYENKRFYTKYKGLKLKLKSVLRKNEYKVRF